MADGSDKEKVKRDGNEWCTPDEILTRVRRVFLPNGGSIDLDPFGNRYAIVHAGREYLMPESDGFALDWQGCVFCNPPFSRAGEAVRKCVTEYLGGCEIVAVIPSSVHASHWIYVDEAPAVCYPKQRVAFMYEGVTVKGNRADVVIVYWGDSPWRFREAFRDYGRVRLG